MEKIHEFDIDFFGKKNKMHCSFCEFPFKTEFSFLPMIKYWENFKTEDSPVIQRLTNEVLELVKKTPGFLKPVKDKKFVEDNLYLVELLLTSVYPAAYQEKIISAVIEPFGMDIYYATKSFKEYFPFEEFQLKLKKSHQFNEMMGLKIVNAYTLILNKFYNQKLRVNLPTAVKVFDDELNLFKYYHLEFNTNFVEIKLNGKLPKLTEKDFETLKNNIWDIDKWSELLPPGLFTFSGMGIISFWDITEQQVLSLLRNDLLDNESIRSFERLKEIRNKIRSFTGLGKVRIGLAAFSENRDSFMNFARKIGDSFVLNEAHELSCEDYKNSVYAKAMEEKKTVVIGNLESYPNKSKVEEAVLKQGIKSLIVAPLFIQDKMVGALEIGSPNPGDLDSLMEIKLRQIYNLFAITLYRSTEEFETRIQAVIKEECTAIHPTVEWRFREAAFNLMKSREKDPSAEFEPIVFENVYPLYGVSDIRDSSNHRNKAIETDLIKQLSMVKDILVKACSIKPLPYLSELIYRTEKKIKNISNGLNTGDEVTTIDFLQTEIADLFAHIILYDKSVADSIEEYNKIINPKLNIYYSERKKYEHSVNLINDVISTYLDAAEEKAQEMFPHYFEKYKTDGVEHSIYIGQSLVSGVHFNKLYLQNLRLWQLIVLSGIAQKLDALKTTLPIPLEVTHLILVQNNPLAISFRPDEKKFDVDGTYNIRYEIMKKRIDKAVVKGTGERVTQPGKIAIIYSQNKEKNEYRKYIDFLQSKRILKNEIEDLDIEELQGIQGLKALRVTVNLDNDKIITENGKNIFEIVNEVKELV